MSNVKSIQEIINPGKCDQKGTKTSMLMNSRIRDLTQSEICEIPFRLTVNQLDYYGFNYSLPVNEPGECPFCGKQLIFIAKRSMMRNTVFAWEETCRCDEYINNQNQLKVEDSRKEAHRKELEEQEAFRKKVDRLFNQSKLGKRFLTRTFNNFKTDNTNYKAFNAVTKYSEKFDEYKKTGTGFIISGPYGTGKTHLAGALAIDLINRGIPVIFGTLISLLGLIRQSYSESWTQDDEITIIDTYSRVDLLIIDDLGKERVSEWTLEKLFTIVNQRYENCLPLVVTCNYSAEALVKRLTVNGNSDVAESVVSRLNEMCRGIFLGGKDRRFKCQ